MLLVIKAADHVPAEEARNFTVLGVPPVLVPDLIILRVCHVHLIAQAEVLGDHPIHCRLVHREFKVTLSRLGKRFVKVYAKLGVPNIRMEQVDESFTPV